MAACPASSGGPVVVVPGWAGLGGGGACGGALPMVPLARLVWSVSACPSGSMSSWQHGSTCSAGVVKPNGRVARC